MTSQKFKIPLACVLWVACALASAQTKITCVADSASGRLIAPLAWQNTLGAARANSLCQLANEQMAAQLQKQKSDAAASEIMQQPHVAVAQVSSKPITPEPRFAVLNAEKVSALLKRWATADGYTLIWEAPAQTDLEMVNGTVDGINLESAITKLVAGLNTKILAKKAANDADAPWLFEIEVLMYSNKVIRIVTKS